MTRPEVARRPWNPPVVILGASLAVLGFVSTLFLGRVIQPSLPAVGGTQSVVVAARDLDQRTTLKSGDLTVTQLSPADVPPGGLSNPAPAVGQVLQAPLKKGQPVLANHLAAAALSTGIQPAYLPLPKGYVAVTLPTAELVGVGGYIQAGDYIDIIAIVVQKGGGPANVRTIYSGVQVIRVGPATDAASLAAARSGGVSSSITVAMSQCQAEFVDWFVNNASLKYTLMSHEDYQAAAGATPDTGCPLSGSARGVTEADVRSHWPGI